MQKTKHRTPFRLRKLRDISLIVGFALIICGSTIYTMNQIHPPIVNAEENPVVNAEVVNVKTPEDIKPTITPTKTTPVVAKKTLPQSSSDQRTMVTVDQSGHYGIGSSKPFPIQNATLSKRYDLSNQIQQNVSPVTVTPNVSTQYKPPIIINQRVWTEKSNQNSMNGAVITYEPVNPQHPGERLTVTYNAGNLKSPTQSAVHTPVQSNGLYGKPQIRMGAAIYRLPAIDISTPLSSLIGSNQKIVSRQSNNDLLIEYIGAERSYVISRVIKIQDVVIAYEYASDTPLSNANKQNVIDLFRKINLADLQQKGFGILG